MARLSHIALIIVMNVLMCVLAEDIKFYSNQYIDNFNLEALNDKDVLEAYDKCFMKTSLCQTLEQKTLIEIFIDAYQTKCKRCTEKQKEILNKIVEWFIKNAPEKWESIIAKIIEDAKKKAG